VIQINHILTADDPLGCPWPPSDGHAMWTVVRRTRGFSLWRSIRIVPALAAAAGADFHLGGKRKVVMTKNEESKEVAVQDDENTELALSPEEEAKALLDEAQKGAQIILKYKDEHFHIRDVEVPLGTRYFAHPGSWERQWIRFDDNKVTERIRVKVSTKKMLPSRNKLSDPELEDTDKDPWSFQNVIPFENVETGEVEVFTTSTAGGRMAIEELVKEYAKAILAGTARGLPIIELQVGSFRTGFGKDQPKPLFPIVDWENPEPAAVPAEPTIIPPEPKSKPKKKKAKAVAVDDELAPAEAMDDEIPF
jgi:hypothetical protein